MHTICLKFGRFSIYWFGVMMAIGFSMGLINWVILGKKENKNLTYCSDLLFWIMIAGILGARIAYVISDIGHFISEPWMIFRIDKGGLIYYGGFAGAVLAMLIFARKHNEKTLSFLDFVATSVPLAHAFGRIGCFLNGCCHGIETSSFLGVSYPAGSIPWYYHLDAGKIDRFTPRSLPVHPVQLYEASLNLFLYIIMLLLYRRKKHDGSITAFYFLTYPLCRFMLEFLRGDKRMRWSGLTVAQIISIAFFIIGCGLLFKIMKTATEDEKNK